MTTPTLSGAAYRVCATHPRREGPLRITDKAGTLIAVSGQTCAHVAPELLASMIRNGYVELVPASEATTDARDDDADEGRDEGRFERGC
jgi:hypothetical protein